MILRPLAVLLLLIGSAQHGFCAPSDLQPVLKKKYSQSVQLYIEFEQSIFWSVREKTTKSSGTIYLAPGDKFRIDLAADLFVSNGEACWQYSKNSKQVIIRNLKDLDLSVHPSYLLASFLDQYNFTEQGRTKQHVTLVSAPQDTASSEYSAVVITAQPQTGIITSLKFTDKNGNIHTYQFKKTIFNKQHPQKLFKFEAPSDADIIDNRK